MPPFNRNLAQWALALAIIAAPCIPALGQQPDDMTQTPAPSAFGPVPSPDPMLDNRDARAQYLFYKPGEALRHDDDPLVATVEGRNIYLSDVGDALQELPPDQRNQPLDLLYPRLLDGLINQAALVLEAQHEHLDNDPAVRRRMLRAAELALGSELVHRTAAKNVTDDAIRARYEQRYGGKTSLEAAHLRVIVLHTRTDAERVLTELAHGSDFAALARTRSIDPSGANGGDIGFVQRDQVSPLVAEAAFALAPGDTTKQPVLDQGKWDVLRVEGRQTMPVPTLDQARDAIIQDLIQEVIRDETIKALAQVQVRKYNLDKTPFQAPNQSLLDLPFNFSAQAKSQQ